MSESFFTCRGGGGAVEPMAESMPVVLTRLAGGDDCVAAAVAAAAAAVVAAAGRTSGIVVRRLRCLDCHGFADGLCVEGEGGAAVKTGAGHRRVCCSKKSGGTLHNVQPAAGGLPPTRRVDRSRRWGPKLPAVMAQRSHWLSVVGRPAACSRFRSRDPKACPVGSHAVHSA